MTLEEQYNEKLKELANCDLFLDNDKGTPARNGWEMRTAEVCMRELQEIISDIKKKYEDNKSLVGTMDGKLIKGLKQSILKWKYLESHESVDTNLSYTDTDEHLEVMGDIDLLDYKHFLEKNELFDLIAFCGLCTLYYDNSCEGCPLDEEGNNCLKKSSIFQRYQEATTVEEQMQIASEMVILLKKILKEVK